MKAFVINLDKDTKRLDQFYDTFRGSPYNIERISGIYGKDVSDNDLSFKCKHLCTNGMKGCSASHRLVWNKIINQNIQTAIVFEDDAYPVSSDYAKEVDQIMLEVPSDYDIINLTNNGGHIYVNFFHKIGLKILGLYNNNHKLISENVCIPKFSATTSAYIISNNGARKLLRLLPKITGHIDMSIYTQYKFLNIYGAVKNIFNQKFEESNNFDKHFLSFLIPNVDMANGFKLDQYLLTSNFKLFGKSMSWFDLILLILTLLILFIITKKYIFLYISLIVLLIYVFLLRIITVP
jgi:glycosyl transferase family 25